MKSYRLWTLIVVVIVIILCIRSSYPFIPTTLINLDRSPDRHIYMTLQCQLQGIPFKRHSAVDGAKYQFTDEEKQMFFGIISGQPGLTIKYRKEECAALFKKREPEKIFKKTKNIMACALSHIQVWRAHRNTTVPFLVLEDDTVVSFQFRQNTNECLSILNIIDPDWDIVWVSGGDPGSRERVAFWTTHELYRMDPPEYIGQGAVGYIISPKGVKHFLGVLDKIGCPYASDAFLLEYLDKSHAYGVHPPLLSSGGLFKTTIG